MKIQTSIFVLIQSVVVLLSENGLAQTSQMVQRDQHSRYVLGKEEQMLLPVNILGMVQKPGQYMV
ncbi:hypothetical protein MJD09_03175, partial [bacterium]|nr:hypothetical protein [bacterium]